MSNRFLQPKTEDIDFPSTEEKHHEKERARENWVQAYFIFLNHFTARKSIMSLGCGRGGGLPRVEDNLFTDEIEVHKNH